MDYLETMDIQNIDIDDRMWALIDPLLPQDRLKPQGGRFPLENYRALCGIIFRLRTGCQWKAVPRRFGSPAAIHRRFQAWVETGIFHKIFAVFVEFYDEVKGIGWEWMSLDGANVKAPKGGSQTGPNPTDRAKSHSERHVLTDQHGVPVAVEISAANTHDRRMVGATIDMLPGNLSDSNAEKPINLCLDKGYDYQRVEEEVRDRNLIPHIRRRGEAPLVGCRAGKPRRWVVERTNSWHNRFRGLLIRWEHKGQNYRGLVLLASALIVFHQTLGGSW